MSVVGDSPDFFCLCVGTSPSCKRRKYGYSRIGQITDDTKDNGTRAERSVRYIFGLFVICRPARSEEPVTNQPEAKEVGAGSHARIDGIARDCAAFGMPQLLPIHVNREYVRR
jgi:hypothetical protein